MVSSKEENILVAAEKLFAQKGFDATTTREISSAANVNISMISYYFGSKDQLLEKLFEYRMRESTVSMTEIVDKDDIEEWEKLMLIVDLYYARVFSMKEFYRVMQHEQITNKNPHVLGFIKKSKVGFLEIYKKLIEEGFAKGIFKNKPRTELLMSSIIGTTFYGMNAVGVFADFNGDDETQYKENFFNDLKAYLKDLIRYIVGYEQN